MDAREGRASARISLGEESSSYYAFPFSAATTESSGEDSFTLDVSVSGSPAKQTLRSPIESLETQSLREFQFHKRIELESIQKRLEWQKIGKAWSERSKIRPDISRLLLQDHSKILTPPPSEITINSPFTGESGTQIIGIHRGETSSVVVYVDSREDASVDQGAIDTVLDAFDQISLPRLKALFGSPTDMDGNGVIILFLATENQIEPGLLGFFQPTDMLPLSSSQASGNVAEIIYVKAPSVDNAIELVHATVAHEAFHLINFSEKTLPLFESTNGGALVIEDRFLNEGQAHLAEDLVGWGVDSQRFAKVYLDCFPRTSLAGSGDSSLPDTSECSIAGFGNDSLPRRGGVFLFLLYLFQQLGGATYSTSQTGDISGPGADFLRELNVSEDFGLLNIATASDRPFFEWYVDFLGALALDSTAVQTETYRFGSEVADPFTGLPRNVRIRSDRVDAIDETIVTTNGPLITETLSATSSFSLTDSLLRTGAKAYLLNFGNGTSIDLSLEASESLALGMVLLPVP